MDEMNLSFSGCGFMGIYHVGVASAIREYAPELASGKITGASAGAMAACGLICGMCLGQATSDVLKVAVQARAKALGPLHPTFNLVRVLRQGLLKNLPNDAHKICTGRLHISLTRFSDGKNILVNQFDTKQELVQALLCSAFIPFYCGTVPPMFKGVRYMDGGWSDNMPILDDNTITVSPFSGESDICPQDYESSSFLSFDLRNTNVRFTGRNIYRIATALFPPHPEILSEMCRQGFEDTLRFLARRGLLSCTRCISVRSSIFVAPKRRSAEIEEEPADVEEGMKSIMSCDEITSDTTPATPSVVVRGIKKFRKEVLDRTATAPLTGLRQHQTSRTARPGTRSLSESHVHHVPDTECESCRQAAQMASGKGLPKIVRDTLEDATAGERTLFRRLLGLAPVRWLRYLAVPWLLPLDITYAVCRSFLEWLPTLPEDGKWLVARLTDAIGFILKELDTHRSLYSSRFTCQMAITETNYSNLTAGPSSAPTPAAVSRRQSVVSDSFGVPPNHCTVAEMNIGFSVDVDSRNQRLRQMNDMVSRIKPDKSVVPASQVAQVADGMEWEALRRAAGNELPTPASLDNARQEDFDNFASILAFTRRQESVMAYYYMDENNRMKVTEIYGLNAKDSDRVASLSRSCSRRHSFRDTSGRQQPANDDSGVSGVSATELEAALLAKVSSAGRRQHETNREARTPGTGVQRSASFPKHRRGAPMLARQVFPGGTLNGRCKTIMIASPISTASESEETELLFVPDRRRRRNDSVLDATAYEPEDSSSED